MKIATGRSLKVLDKIHDFCGLQLEKQLPTDPFAVEIRIMLNNEALKAEVLWRNFYRGEQVDYVERFLFGLDENDNLFPLILSREENFSFTQNIPVAFLSRLFYRGRDRLSVWRTKLEERILKK